MSAGSSWLGILAIGAAGAALSGCAVGPDAVRHDRRPTRSVQAAGPGYLGDPAAMLGVVVERLDAEPGVVSCDRRSRRVFRCHLERDTGGWYDVQGYVDVRISADGMRLTARGPRIARFSHRYARRR